jgi:hypothetical protein
MIIGGIPMILLLIYSSIITNKKWFGGYELVTVDPSSIEIESRMWGATKSIRHFMNQSVRNLRYEEWFPKTGRMRLRQNGIRFECDGVTQTVALDAETSDCMDLIDQMIDVYKFPTGPSRDPTAIVSLL